VLGVSFDAPEDNKAFAEAESFPFPLLSDVDHSVADAYGARRPPEDPLAAYVAKRVTFLIDPEGVVRKVYEVTDVASHPEEVVADLEALRR
jgi:peroxiredoxin Q/BCP